MRCCLGVARLKALVVGILLSTSTPVLAETVELQLVGVVDTVSDRGFTGVPPLSGDVSPGDPFNAVFVLDDAAFLSRTENFDFPTITRTVFEERYFGSSAVISASFGVGTISGSGGSGSFSYTFTEVTDTAIDPSFPIEHSDHSQTRQNTMSIDFSDGTGISNGALIFTLENSGTPGPYLPCAGSDMLCLLDYPGWPTKRVLITAFQRGDALVQITSASVAPPSEEVVVVVPNAYETIDAPGNNAAPFFRRPETSFRYQQVHESSEFSELSEPLFISEIAFRPDFSAGSAFGHTIPDIQVNLSTTSRSSGAMSDIYDDNVGPDDKVVVYRGPLTLSSSFTGPTGGPMEFDVVIPMDKPFLYDPTSGNLLLDLRIYELGSPALNFLDRPTATDRSVMERVRCPTDCNVGDEAGSTSGNGLVVKFTLPEPSAALLHACALLALAAMALRRVHRTHAGGKQQGAASTGEVPRAGGGE